MSSLHEAARAGHVKKVQDLLIRGYDVDDEDRNGQTPLHHAAMGGDVAVMKVLLGSGGSLYATATGKWCSGVTALHFAAEYGQLPVVRFLLKSGVDPSIRDTERYTPLHYAAENDHVDVMQCLIAAGTEVDVADRLKKTPLHYAAESGARKALDFLLDARACMDALDISSKTPMMYAAESGDTDIIDRLLKRNASLHQRAQGQWCGGLSVLHLAAERGHLMVCKLLMQAGIPVDVRDDGQYTPLHYAAEAGHQDLVIFLVSVGACPVSKDKLGMTPLHYAAESGSQKAVQFLLHKAADPGAVDLNGRSPLHCVCARTARVGNASTSSSKPLRKRKDSLRNTHYLEVAQTLVNCGASANRADKSGLTPLHCAALAGGTEVAGYLLSIGAAVNARDGRQWTALHHAAALGECGMVQLLVLMGANLNAPGQGQWSSGVKPLHLAAENGKADCAKTLLQYGGDPNVLDDAHYAPLHYAAERNEVAAVDALLAGKASVDIHCCEGKTALHYAAQNGAADAVKALLLAGASPSSTDLSGRTPLMYAVAPTEVVGTPLEEWEQEMQCRAVSLLLDARSDLSASDKANNTALQLATQFGSSRVLATLVTARSPISPPVKKMIHHTHNGKAGRRALDPLAPNAICTGKSRKKQSSPRKAHRDALRDGEENKATKASMASNTPDASLNGRRNKQLTSADVGQPQSSDADEEKGDGIIGSPRSLRFDIDAEDATPTEDPGCIERLPSNDLNDVTNDSSHSGDDEDAPPPEVIPPPGDPGLTAWEEPGDSQPPIQSLLAEQPVAPTVNSSEGSAGSSEATSESMPRSPMTGRTSQGENSTPKKKKKKKVSKAMPTPTSGKTTGASTFPKSAGVAQGVGWDPPGRGLSPQGHGQQSGSPMALQRQPMKRLEQISTPNSPVLRGRARSVTPTLNRTGTFEGHRASRAGSPTITIARTLPSGRTTPGKAQQSRSALRAW